MSQSDRDAFQRCLNDEGVAAGYLGDGEYSGPARRLHRVFMAGVEHGRQSSKRVPPELAAHIRKMMELHERRHVVLSVHMQELEEFLEQEGEGD